MIITFFCVDDKSKIIPKANNIVTDAVLFSLITESGYSFYVGTPSITAAKGNSPHGYERVRFNSIAKSALDSSGKLPKGSQFPKGSIIVKDIYTGINGSINLYAVMKKDENSSQAGSNYLWAEYDNKGSVVYSINEKGSGCISCHSGGASRDLVRTFDLN